MYEHQGATNEERLLAAARSDNEDMLLEIFEEDFDINFQDGLGNTALHYAVQYGSTDVLEHILSHDNCDVDPVNKLQGATPLHVAVTLDHPELRKYVVESLLEAGADTTIKDKNGERAEDLISRNDHEILGLFKKAKAQNAISHDDIASDDEGEVGSGSEEED